jgi:putative transposase
LIITNKTAIFDYVYMPLSKETNGIMYPKEHPDFFTVTCLDWKHLLEDDNVKDIIINSLRFLVQEDRVSVYAFAIMNNHVHLIWQMNGEHKREDVQRDFLKFTAQAILRYFRKTDPEILNEVRVDAKDRRYQVWERNALSVPLWSVVIYQKLGYIHNNPVEAGLCRVAEEYKYSSASYYYSSDKHWDFLTHVDG